MGNVITSRNEGWEEGEEREKEREGERETEREGERETERERNWEGKQNSLLYLIFFFEDLFLI
jgi:hypothetical protein